MTSKHAQQPNQDSHDFILALKKNVSVTVKPFEKSLWGVWGITPHVVTCVALYFFNYLQIKNLILTQKMSWFGATQEDESWWKPNRKGEPAKYCIFHTKHKEDSFPIYFLSTSLRDSPPSAAWKWSVFLHFCAGRTSLVQTQSSSDTSGMRFCETHLTLKHRCPTSLVGDEESKPHSQLPKSGVKPSCRRAEPAGMKMAQPSSCGCKGWGILLRLMCLFVCLY